MGSEMCIRDRLRVYEMALDHFTNDSTESPALSESECASAMAYGMMAVEDGVDVICVGEMGIGNTTSAAALSCALFGGGAQDWTGTGTGIDKKALERKVSVIRNAAAQRGLARSRSIPVSAKPAGKPLPASLHCLLPITTVALAVSQSEHETQGKRASPSEPPNRVGPG